MSKVLKLCEHESVEWILRKIPKFIKLSILKKLNASVTSFDVNVNVFVLGTNNGTLYILNRHNNSMEHFTIKKNNAICYLKLIHSIDLSVGIGFDDGSLYILNIPFNDNLNYSEMSQFIVPTGHSGSISAIAWSRNAAKLFSGDANGLIWCTEIDYLNKTVSTYEVCNTQVKVFQLAYYHSYLIIANEVETFMWDFNVNKRIQIGTQSRNERGRFGISFVNKLCKIDEMEIIVARPDCKLWISDIKGSIKKTIMLKTHMIFVPEKLISLLPCFTSQSRNQLIDGVESEKTRFQLGLSIPINESETLFWSPDAIVIINIISGNIIWSSCNLGKIETVSVCLIDQLLKKNSNLSIGSDFPNPESLALYEIWILRQPVGENDNKLVRLSHIPLVTSKLLIDPYYFFSQAKILNIKENLPINSKILEETNSNITDISRSNSSSKISLDSNSLKEDIPEANVPNSQFENFLNKIGVKAQNIDVVETLNDMRTNMLEFTKITKEVVKQSQAIFESIDEVGVEQAIELTEEGLMITFEKPVTPINPVNILTDHEIDCVVNEIAHSNIPTQRARRENRQIHVVNLEESSEILDISNSDKNSDSSLPKDNKEIYLAEKTFSYPSTNYGLQGYSFDSSENLDSYMNESIDQSMSPEIVDNFFSNTHHISEKEGEEAEDEEDDDEEKECLNVAINEKNLFDPNNDHDRSDIQTSSESNEISNIEYILDIEIETDDSIETPIPTESTELYDSLKSAITDNETIKPSEELLGHHATDNDDKIPDIMNLTIDHSLNHNSLKCLSKTLMSNLDISYVPIEGVESSEKDTKSSEITSEKNDNKPCEITSVDEKPTLTNSILLKCNKWISHRGPNLSYNIKLSSMEVNRRMIWLSDTKGNLFVGFIYVETDQDSNDIKAALSANNKMLWFCDSELRTDKICSSPEGFILWREKAGEISVYTGVTKIWSPKVVKEKVLNKNNWETTMQGIKDIDIDDDMAVIVTKKGQLKVMEGMSGRTPYTRSSSVDITGQVTLATIFNGIIWVVTELNMQNVATSSQHIFACVAKDENNKCNISYWRTVPLARDLVRPDQQVFGVLGGSELIRSIKLGTNNLAWILTLNNMCFFSQKISSDDPVGDGIWYQITLQFLSQTPWYCDDGAPTFHNRVEKMLGYQEVDTKNKRASINTNSAILLSVKCPPKRSKGNGLLWITSVERNSPCILFESDKDILGHRWVECFEFRNSNKNRLMGLPAITFWSCVESAGRNTLWLLHKSGELFCYWNESKIRNVAIPSSFGKILKISARNATVAVLTSLSKILIRSGITESNPFGADWKEIKNGFRQKETIRNISCSDNEIWIIYDDLVYHHEDIQSLLFDSSKKSIWNFFNFKLNDSSSRRLSMLQHWKSGDSNCILGISDPEGYLYMSVWKSFTNNLTWTYILGPRAKSIHLAEENLWMVEQVTGNIFVLCGLDWKNQLGDYWLHIPLITSPVIDVAVSSTNEVFVIDACERLLSHRWTSIEGNSQSALNSQVPEISKTEDQDWEMLN